MAMDLKNWTVRTRDIETGHEFYAPNDDLTPTELRNALEKNVKVVK